MQCLWFLIQLFRNLHCIMTESSWNLHLVTSIRISFPYFHASTYSECKWDHFHCQVFQAERGPKGSYYWLQWAALWRHLHKRRHFLKLHRAISSSSGATASYSCLISHVTSYCNTYYQIVARRFSIKFVKVNIQMVSENPIADHVAWKVLLLQNSTAAGYTTRA